MASTTFRERIENMYELHLVLLLLLTVIISFLVVFYVKQQHDIRSLEFRLQFMRDQYEKQREYNGTILDRTKPGVMLESGSSEESLVAPAAAME